MDDVYSFIDEAEPVKKIESHSRIVMLMTQQATECAYFIRDYTMNKSFCMLTSALHAETSYHYLYQGNGPSKTLFCRMLMTRFRVTKIGSKNCKWDFKVMLFFRPESPSLEF